MPRIPLAHVKVGTTPQSVDALFLHEPWWQMLVRAKFWRPVAGIIDIENDEDAGRSSDAI